jgi:hypothetical protein
VKFPIHHESFASTLIQGEYQVVTKDLGFSQKCGNVKLQPLFDEMWLEWIGPEVESWPQRACIEAGLASGLLVELTAVAARE